VKEKARAKFMTVQVKDDRDPTGGPS
jgi:hypothetical protein